MLSWEGAIEWQYFETETIWIIFETDGNKKNPWVLSHKKKMISLPGDRTPAENFFSAFHARLEHYPYRPKRHVAYCKKKNALVRPNLLPDENN